jgi:hypothetical protein
MPLLCMSIVAARFSRECEDSTQSYDAGTRVPPIRVRIILK